MMRFFSIIEERASQEKGYESRIQLYTQYKILCIVIEHCKSINEIDKKTGMTALTLASQLASPLLVNLLLHRGAVPIIKKEQKVSNSITIQPPGSYEEVDVFLKKNNQGGGLDLNLRKPSKERIERLRVIQSRFIPRLKEVQLLYTFPALNLPRTVRELIVEFHLPAKEDEKLKPKLLSA